MLTSSANAELFAEFAVSGIREPQDGVNLPLTSIYFASLQNEAQPHCIGTHGGK